MGDALRVVRSVDDMRGIGAWQKLFEKYSLRTMSRGLRTLTQTVNPLKAKELNEVDDASSRWEENAKMLAAQLQEN